MRFSFVIVRGHVALSLGDGGAERDDVERDGALFGRELFLVVGEHDSDDINRCSGIDGGFGYWVAWGSQDLFAPRERRRPRDGVGLLVLDGFSLPGGWNIVVEAYGWQVSWKVGGVVSGVTRIGVCCGGDGWRMGRKCCGCAVTGK